MSPCNRSRHFVTGSKHFGSTRMDTELSRCYRTCLTCGVEFTARRCRPPVLQLQLVAYPRVTAMRVCMFTPYGRVVGLTHTCIATVVPGHSGLYSLVSCCLSVVHFFFPFEFAADVSSYPVSFCPCSRLRYFLSHHAFGVLTCAVGRVLCCALRSFFDCHDSSSTVFFPGLTAAVSSSLSSLLVTTAIYCCLLYSRTSFRCCSRCSSL